MKLVARSVAPSPDSENSVRSTGTIEFNSGERIDVWFEVPGDLAGHLSDSGNPWLLAMLPYALQHGEAVVLELPVDRELLDNLKGLLMVWCEWYPQFKVPQIDATPSPLGSFDLPERRCAAFFSGGIDSWFTTLRHCPEIEPEAIGQVDDLILVHGFDIPLEHEREFETLRTMLAEAAGVLQRRLVVVKTNLRARNTLWHSAWGWLSHGAALAAVALTLEKRFKTALIGSTGLTYACGALSSWGSHPLTDPLCSSSALAIRHDGTAWTRPEKTALVARHDLALSHLHVCWERESAGNCGRCAKCLRTMATLYLLGAERGLRAFDQPFSPARLATARIGSDIDRTFAEQLRTLAVQVNEVTVETAMTAALARYRRVRPILPVLDRLDGLPLAWRISRRLRQALMN